jgi:hypothetical protein
MIGFISAMRYFIISFNILTFFLLILLPRLRTVKLCAINGSIHWSSETIE